MTAIRLTLGPLGVADLGLERSGLRWLCSDGYICRANEVVAYCDLSVTGPLDVFGEERFDLQVALAPRVAGRVRRAGTASPGGLLDRVPRFPWSPETVWAELEPLAGVATDGAEEPNLLFLAGRRFNNIAEDRSGLLTGWHDRTRAWWGDGQGATLLAAGACDLSGLIRGDDAAYAGMFELARGPAQVVMTHSEVVIPCAAILRQQLLRAPDATAAIQRDFAEHFQAGGDPPTAADWLFVGALLNGVGRSLLNERYDLLTRSGVSRAPPASAICLSLIGESHYLLRHRRLGYVLNMFAYRLEGLGPAVRGWLREAFEPYFQGVDDIARDYAALVAAAPDRSFVFVNRISAHPNENIQSYDLLDAETIAHTHGLRNQELNLMLHDLARGPNVEILDADAIAADLGVMDHLPDGVHATGVLLREMRGELFRLLRAQGVSGF
ncbi:MAG: hypothetical protein KKE02_15305 [Alphaproteobacteria bacterium]|nr:hypothetical protein [Alphaproteobacteria bacterium]MBU1516789.1 hypothetical protein [Alphaproteobacteria bacterium]MBU2092483.1 hypothetical protein [Alphaproteobacteria bacterium]MBU2152386.1 hypothetical protein [Alphaproteobacteria bacterium]MBU2305597.1 hypothetical protein [Alphaproteobacteria bacterium]